MGNENFGNNKQYKMQYGNIVQAIDKLRKEIGGDEREVDNRLDTIAEELKKLNKNIEELNSTIKLT